MDAQALFSKIQARLGFIPPFFEPASEQPEVLENLWQQTEHAYLDNPLPALFKEKLAAVLGRYCEVPYCLMCHTCTLRPLGMQGPAILELLRRQSPSDGDIDEALRRVDLSSEKIAFPVRGQTEQDLFCLASAIYFAGPLAGRSRGALRRRLTESDYQHLVIFIAYNKLCHEWMGAHPEVSFELDQRYLQNYTSIGREAPGMIAYFAQLALNSPPAPPTGLGATSTARAAERSAERSAEGERAVAISERRFQEVLGQLNEQMTQAMQSASEKEQLLEQLRRSSEFAQELVAIVSHDLRNPLNAIAMGTQMALETAPDAEWARPLRRVAASVERAERLIYDLLDFSQARAGGGLPIRLQPVDLADVAQTAVDELSLAQPSREIRVRFEGGAQGEWDPDRLAQAISNLLANAMAHGRQDRPVEVDVRGQGERVIVIIGNANQNGPIPAELLPVLFDPFKRGVARAVSRNHSIGLGLYIVDQIVLGHRGRLEAQSTEEQTTFTITLPRRASSPPIEPIAKG